MSQGLGAAMVASTQKVKLIGREQGGNSAFPVFLPPVAFFLFFYDLFSSLCHQGWKSVAENPHTCPH